MLPNDPSTKQGVVAQPARTAVIVLGAPRSGTSAVSQMLTNIGVFFGRPEDFVDPVVHPHNPIFFELQKLNDINDQLLDGIGVTYGDFDLLPDSPDFKAPREVLAKAVEGVESLVLSQLDGADLIGLKDPRFVFTLPFWDAELRRLGYTPKYILATRATDAIVASNCRVNGCSVEHNRRLEWLSLASAGLQLEGKDFLVIDFDELVREPLVAANQVAAWLGLEADSTALAGASIDSGLLSHRGDGESTLSPGRSIAAMADEYRRFRDLLARRGFIELLDRRRREVRGLVRALQVAERKRENNVDAILDGVAASRAAANDLMVAVGEERDRLSAMAALLVERLDAEAQSARALYERRVLDLESAVFDREARIREMDQLTERMQAELKSAVSSLEGTISEKERLLARSQADLAEANKLIAGLKMQFSEQEDHLRRLTFDWDEQMRKFDAETARWASERASLGDEFAMLREERDRLRGELELERRPWYKKMISVLVG